ncbi:histidine kinase-like protein [Actinorugispora endophytica]|uniref:Histidine kinase-like protein n=1 Tax=Actinorugispora endophytica TaxID=1605990 RepID=A0A4R6UY51_9ACTN|nr:histidine kinase-like protein [Actinorugispora endophytica]
MCGGGAGLGGSRLASFGVTGARADDARVMVGELVANAVRYGEAPVVLAVWRWAAGCVVVEVRDAGAGWPVLPSPVAPADVAFDAEGGRGLPVVTAYSGGLCGVEPLPGGKTVWFALASGAPVLSAGELSVLVRARNERRLGASARPGGTGLPARGIVPLPRSATTEDRSAPPLV